MRLFFPSGARAAPSDRGYQNVGALLASNGVAPHATTTRQFYTCPAGKKAKIVNTTGQLLRATAAAPVGLWFMQQFITQLNLATCYVYFRSSLGNNIGDATFHAQPTSVILLPTETTTVQTADASTGGTLNLNFSAQIGEYDA
jgi:hypothetical protein